MSISKSAQEFQDVMISRRIAARYRQAGDLKAVVNRLLKNAERDLRPFKTFASVESPPARGGYGPYDIGTLQVANFQIRIVADQSNGSIGIGAYSGPHALQSLSSRGTVKDAPARLKKVTSYLKETLDREAKKEQERTAPPAVDERGTWSVVTVTDGYASEVELFDSKERAEAAARDQGDVYVVKGTQMWNEPLGQVEEHGRQAPSRYFR